MKNGGAAKTAVNRKKEMMHPGNISSLSFEFVEINFQWCSSWVIGFY